MTLTAVINEPSNSLIATVTTNAESITATFDPYVIQQARIDLYELAKQKGFVGTFDEFLVAIQEPAKYISTDPNNDLKLGSDNKLMVATDELNTSFNYASSVSTFWSI